MALTGFDLCRAAMAVDGTTAPEQSVLLALAVMADGTAQCWPGVTGRLGLVGKTKLGERTIRRALQGLAKAGHITIKEVSGKGNLYTVHPCRCGTPASEAPCHSGTPATQAVTPAAVAPNLPRTTITKKASPSPSRAGAAHLPDDWAPIRFADNTVAREVIDRRGREWGRAALESFKNHWRSANGPNSRKRDWQAAWANWTIEQDRRDGRRNGMAGHRGGSVSGHGRTVDAALAFIADGQPH